MDDYIKVAENYPYPNEQAYNLGKTCFYQGSSEILEVENTFSPEQIDSWEKEYQRGWNDAYRKQWKLSRYMERSVRLREQRNRQKY